MLPYILISVVVVLPYLIAVVVVLPFLIAIVEFIVFFPFLVLLENKNCCFHWLVTKLGDKMV